MRLIKIILIIIINIISTSLHSKEVEYKPTMINFRGALGSDSTLIVYGDVGTYYLSNDLGLNWEYKNIKNCSDIVKIFYENDRIVAFTNKGEVFVSYDKTKNWEYILTLDVIEENANYFVKVNDNYVFSDYEYLYLIDINFNLITKIKNDLNIRSYIAYKRYFYPNLIIYFGDNILFYNNYNSINVYDKNLNFIKNIAFNDYFDCTRCEGFFDYNANQEQLSMLIWDKIYFLNKELEIINKIPQPNFLFSSYYDGNKLFFKSESERGGSIFEYDNDTSYIEKFYYFNQKKYSNGNLRYQFIVHQNKCLVYGNYNYLAIRDMNEKDTSIYFDIISDGSLRNNDNMHIINDVSYENNDNKKEYLTIRQSGNKWSHDVGNITLGQSNINLQVEKNNAVRKKLEFNISSQVYHYDERINTFYLLSRKSVEPEILFTSKDTCNTFTSKDVSKIINIYISTKLKFQNDNESSGYYLITNNKYGSSDYVLIEKFDSAFTKSLSTSSLSKEEYFEFEVINSNTYIGLTYNIKDNVNNLKYSEDEGNTWNIIKEYSNELNILETKELIINKKKYWAVRTFNYLDNMLSVDIVDVYGKKVINIFKNKLNNFEVENLDYIGISTDGLKLFLTLVNNLYISNTFVDITENAIEWSKFTFENNGKIRNKFYILDNYIYAQYSDDIHPENLYWINNYETLLKTSIETNPASNFLIFPNPTSDRVSVDLGEIVVGGVAALFIYDILGNEIMNIPNYANKSEIDVSTIPIGTYTIQIQTSTGSVSQRLLVNR